jgi:hypothetical protein
MASFLSVSVVGLCVIAKDGLADGAVYSPAAFGLHTWLVYKSSSPHAYWAIVIFYIISAVALFGFVIYCVYAAITMERKGNIDENEKRDGNVRRE